MEMTTLSSFPCGEYSYPMLKFAVGPAHDVSGLLHGSVVGAAETGWEVNVGTTVGDAAAKSTAVGEGADVSVGSGVGAGVSVGGMAVLVGTAACVSAIIVDAIETAVDCTASALMVGSAGVLAHALSNRLSMMIPAPIFFFIRYKFP
jgi:hypothetical protein